VYRRVNRWAKLGVLERLFYALEKERIAKVGVKLLALDSTSCKIHPDGMQSIGETRGGWNTKLHVVSADDKVVIALKLCSGREHGSRSGKELLKDKGAVGIKMPLLMDRAYEGDEMRKLARG
jgi:hypothetical protein